MNTDELITLLARDVEPVDRAADLRRNAAALLASAGFAVALTLALLGLRTTDFAGADLPFYYARQCFCAILCLLALAMAYRLSTPGRHGAAPAVALAIVLAAMWLLAAYTLAVAIPAEREQLLLGHTWKVCSALIALLSLPYLLACTWILRRRAPTDLRRAGAAAGAAAGALAALTYTLHCPEVAPPFIAIWYVLGMGAPVLLGAVLGPRLLRW